MHAHAGEKTKPRQSRAISKKGPKLLSIVHCTEHCRFSTPNFSAMLVSCPVWMPFQKPWCSLCFTQQSIGGALLLPPSSKDGTSWNHTCTTQAENCYWSKVTVQTFLTKVIPSEASEVGLPQVNPDWHANSPKAATDMWFQPMRTAAWATLGIVIGMKLVKDLGAGKPPLES